MQVMTIEQLRAASDAGGVAGVTLKGEGAAFLVQIATSNGAIAVLAKARSSAPRRFGNPLSALNLLRDIGITIGQFDATEYDPAMKDQSPNRRDQAGLTPAEAATYDKWLAAEIQAAIDDPRPNLSHDEVMAKMTAEIASIAHSRKHIAPVADKT